MSEEPFPSKKVKVPTYVFSIRIGLLDKISDGTNPAVQKAQFEVEFHDQNEQLMEEATVAGNLIPHISVADRAWLQDFMARMRVKAETELLPTP